jgi:formylglycine-generating enzyme required for sulfatase activity
MAIHIVIPTLQGLSHVQDIIKEDPDVRSVICLNGTAQSLPISQAYYDFVKKGQGLIAKEFGHEAWRIDLSEPVEMGNSWQLAIYLTHYFYSKNLLGSGEPKPGDVVIWASGAVKVNRDVAPVEGIERKLAQSLNALQQFQAQQIPVLVVMCEANHALIELPDFAQRVVLNSCADMNSLMSALAAHCDVSEALTRPASAGPEHSTPQATVVQKKHSTLPRFLLGCLLMAGLAFGAYWFLHQTPSTPPDVLIDLTDNKQTLSLEELRSEQQKLALYAEEKRLQQARIAAENAAKAAKEEAAREQARLEQERIDQLVQSLEMVHISEGIFLMGSDNARADEAPAHTVLVPAFKIMAHELTWEQYQPCIDDGVCSSGSDEGWGKGKRPVINVGWHDAQSYIEWLNKKTGKSYRLPSEAEWEYAARAGSRTKYTWGNTIGRNQANCDGCGSFWDNKQTAPVGSFKANHFGLYDMHGNVWEWTQDCWNPSYQGTHNKAEAWETGNCNARVLRGGSWGFEPDSLRSASRIMFSATARYSDFGFRLVED